MSERSEQVAQSDDRHNDPVTTGLGIAGVAGLKTSYDAGKMLSALEKWKQKSRDVHREIDPLLSGVTKAEHAPAELASKATNDQIARWITSYEDAGKAVANQRILGVKVAKPAMNLYHNVAGKKLIETAHDAPYKEGLSQRLIELLTAPVRELTDNPSSYDRELLRGVQDHYRLFQEKDRHALLQHWMHRMQREIDRPAFNLPRAYLEDMDQMPRNIPRILEDPTTHSGNVLQRLTKAREPGVSAAIKQGFADTILTMVGDSKHHTPAADIYTKGARPVLAALKSVKYPAAAALVAIPAVMAYRKGRGDPVFGKQAEEENNGHPLTTAAGEVTGAGALTAYLTRKVKKVGASRLNPFGKLRVDLTGWDRLKNPDQVLKSPELGDRQLNSFEAQLRAWHQALVRQKIEPGYFETGGGESNAAAKARLNPLLKKTDAVIQLGDSAILDKLNKDIHRQGVLRVRAMTDFGTGSLMQRAKLRSDQARTTNPMFVSNPHFYDMMAVPGKEVLSDAVAGKFRSEFGTLRDAHLRNKLEDVTSIPVMHIFNGAGFNAKKAGEPAYAVLASGGGSGAGILFRKAVHNALGHFNLPHIPMEPERALTAEEFAQRQKEIAAVVDQPGIIDDMSRALRQKHGNDFELEVLTSRPQFSQAHSLIDEMRRRQAAGDPRFANVTLTGAKTKVVQLPNGKFFSELVEDNKVTQAGVLERYKKAHYVAGLPGSTMAELAAMKGQAPKLIVLQPDEKILPTAAHWADNTTWMERVFPGSVSTNLDNDADRARAVSGAIRDGWESAGHHSGVTADLSGILKQMEKKIRTGRWKNVGLVGGAGLASTTLLLDAFRRARQRQVEQK